MDPLPQSGLASYRGSTIETGDSTFFLANREEGRRCLGVLGESAGFSGERQGDLLVCPLSAANAAALRAGCRWLRPVPLGMKTSAGLGDRLGLATPGHARAARRFPAIAPIFAQQSVRENDRTGRTPQQVLDDAMWGLFQEGWRGVWGADADHLKTVVQVDAFVDAGYTLFTIDPGEHVDHTAHAASPAAVETSVAALPWETLEDTVQDLEMRYLGRPGGGEDALPRLDRETLWRAAAKYGRAVAHTARMYRYLAGRMAAADWELEVSVDETATPTSPAEHYYVASELRRLGVRWVGLAPRYVGRFEKGVDYIGDLEGFSGELARHAAVARALGPYKLSLHSGSDKFSIYAIAVRHTGGLVHLKTAGTSYLEALRAIAQVDPAFFRAILSLARAHYQQDRATYHVSGQLDRVPPPEALSDAELLLLLDQFDARQVLHVTFGAVLDQFRDRLLETLDRHQERYFTLLEGHFVRHLEPFSR